MEWDQTSCSAHQHVPVLTLDYSVEITMLLYETTSIFKFSLHFGHSCMAEEFPDGVLHGCGARVNSNDPELVYTVSANKNKCGTDMLPTSKILKIAMTHSHRHTGTQQMGNKTL